MEDTSVKAKRLFRNTEQIKALLDAQMQGGLSVKMFCEANKIASGSFHNWQKKYRADHRAAGFTKVNILPVLPALFAEVKGIKLYQPESAAYLKELLV